MREIASRALRAVVLIGVGLWLGLTVHGLAVAAAMALMAVMAANDVMAIQRERSNDPA